MHNPGVNGSEPENEHYNDDTWNENEEEGTQNFKIKNKNYIMKVRYFIVLFNLIQFLFL